MNYTKGSKAAALIARLAEAKENVSALQLLWQTVIGDPVPDQKQCMIWLTRHDFDVVSESVSDLANWVSKHTQLAEEATDEFNIARTKYINLKNTGKPTAQQVKEYNAAVDEYNEARRLHTKGRLDLIKYVSGIMKWKEAEPTPKRKTGTPASDDGSDDVVTPGEGFNMEDGDSNVV